jgi:hypothetical protein
MLRTQSKIVSWENIWKKKKKKNQCFQIVGKEGTSLKMDNFIKYLTTFFTIFSDHAFQNR